MSAAVEACRLRLRPILMTSLAFTLGVVPLYLAIGAGAEMRIALGTGVFWGMIGVTLFGLIFTPVFYVVIRRAADRRRRRAGAATAAVRLPGNAEAARSRAAKLIATSNGKTVCCFLAAALAMLPFLGWPFLAGGRPCFSRSALRRQFLGRSCRSSEALPQADLCFPQKPDNLLRRVSLPCQPFPPQSRLEIAHSAWHHLRGVEPPSRKRRPRCPPAK